MTHRLLVIFMEKFSVFVPVVLVANFLAPCSALKNLTTDQSALLSFKSHLTRSDVLTQNWSAATSCCTWIGVTCGARHQRVTALNLANMRHAGTIPPHLGNLSFLASLDLSYNKFHGQLSPELGFLHRLKRMRLNDNNFTGELPLWFGNLTKLETLTLDQNQFYGQITLDIFRCTQLQILSLKNNQFTASIPREIGNLTMLKQLYLGPNHLEGVIPREMGSLVKLEALGMAINSLTGPFPLAFFNLSSLKRLSLSTNNLSGSAPEDVCFHLPNLEELYLSNNQFTGSIPSGSWGCRGLKVLALNNNRFTGNIPKEIGNLTAMTGIYLENNDLNGAIPVEMANLNTLEVLNLQNNSLTGPIPHAIFNISTMTDIGLASNNLTGQLPSTIGIWLPNLEHLNLFGNSLEGVIPNFFSNASKLRVLDLSLNSFTSSIPNTLGDIRLIEWLHLSNNFLTTDTSMRFLTSLTNCQFLTSLAFNNNPLSGILPVSIGNFSASLRYFYASDCKIRGSIPREIGNLTNLLLLTLYRNELTRSIPTTIRRLQMLQELSVRNNRLQGPIPYDLCHLKNLSSLHLGDNKLSGSIPTCVDNFTFLRILFLGSNKLTSIIPSTLWKLTGILMLNLSTNSLSGNLPAEMANLKVATRIDLSRNQLTGNIPSSVGSLQNLVNLSLADNRLQGPIPQSFDKAISLELLDISRNNLSGVIPKSLITLVHLTHLNLSFNRLEGEIPTGGPFANFSALSYMMNQALCGPARLQVPPCKSDSLQPSRTIVGLLKYILPTTTSAILLVALILVWMRCRKGPVSWPTQAYFSAAEWRRISYHELVQATNGFCESNLLGTGSFVSVYQGKLRDGVNVAVKVFNLHQEGAFKSFETECEVLRNIRHRNLVKIISSCVNIDFKCLVLEYMPNGSLEKWLYSLNYCLDFLQRLNIMIDVATALEYLHHGCSTPVVHCDLKPNNVLLDEDMIAHEGDFGIAKLFGEQESMTHTQTLATIGYMAPEYGSGGVVSFRGDVYSFGILIMETFTRTKSTDEMFDTEMSLKRWVKDSVPHDVNKVADANLLRKEEEHFAPVKDCIAVTLELALDCSKDAPEERVGINDVLVTLKKIRNKFEMSVGTRTV